MSQVFDEQPILSPPSPFSLHAPDIDDWWALQDQEAIDREERNRKREEREREEQERKRERKREEEEQRKREEEERERERKAEERREWLARVARLPPWGIPDHLKKELAMMKRLLKDR